MTRWRCEMENCPLRGVSKVCGDGKDGPVVVSYHPSNGNKECYVRHSVLCWEEWKRVFDRYIRSIHRVFRKTLFINVDLKVIENICGVAVLHHDVGKLCADYQSARFYRHEMISSFLIHDYVVGMLKNSSLDEEKAELLSSIVSAAVYLHHEGLQISHEYYEMRAPTYGYLLNLLAGREFRMVESWMLISSELEKYAFGRTLGYFANVSSVSGYEVTNVLGSVITLVDGAPDPLPLRLAVASILHPITITDNLASQKRGGKPSLLSSFLGVTER
ncbi:MAG: hypothetical protein QXN15_11295 [Candidatus Jordarchaeales archaeon]|nr:hypothetical protein [Candidatus Jordarchaeia archaeon]